jgi:hypothetical protein
MITTEVCRHYGAAESNNILTSFDLGKAMATPDRETDNANNFCLNFSAPPSQIPAKFLTVYLR